MPRRETRVTRYILAAALLFVALSVENGSGNDVVQLRIPAAIYMEPATVQFTITVEPDERNRVLRLEADAGGYYRSTEATLEGAGQKRVHQIEFRNLPSGAYTVRAAVIAGSDDVRGTAVQNMTVK